MFGKPLARALSRVGRDQRSADAYPRRPAPVLLPKMDGGTP